MHQWIENPGTGELPYSKGTLIDVQYRGAGIEYAVECGGMGATDWALDDVVGDILAYRLHTKTEEVKNNGKE